MSSPVADWHGFQKLVMAPLLVGAMTLEEYCVQLVKEERCSLAGSQPDIEVALREQHQQLQAARDMQQLEFLQFDEEVQGSQVKCDIGFQTLDTNKARLVLCILILLRN